MTSAVTDFTQYSTLRAAASEDGRNPDVLREVAGQFEALFVQTLLKNMRDTSLGDPIFGQSNQHDMYLEMLDKQMAVEMTRERGFGLSDVLVRQLLGNEASTNGIGQDGNQAFPIGQRPSAPVPAAAESGEIPAAGSPGRQTETGEVPAAEFPADAADETRWASPREFVEAIWPHARESARRVGVEPRAIVAQAALETGWGEHVMRDASGDSSYNLFGIKAGSDWQGATVTKPTLEYRDGVAYREQARFRAYESIGAAFDDYVNFLSGRPRYEAALASGGDGERFAVSLQEAGYATDPLYARKIKRVMQSETLESALESLNSVQKRPITRATATIAAR